MTASSESPGLARKEQARDRPPIRRGVLVRRLVVMALLLTLAVGGLYGFNRFRERAIADFFAHNKPPPTPVAAAEAKAEAVPKFLTGIGTLSAVREVVVTPEVGGGVTQIFFESGARVKAGDPLVQLNDKTEQADLLSFRAQAKLAEVSLHRSKELLARQAAAQATVDQNQAQLDQVAASIQKTQALIAQKFIRAPFGGVLGIRQIDVGQFLNPGGKIVTLTDLSKLYVNFTLPEQMRSQVAAGQALQIHVDAFPGQTFSAAISTIEPQVSADMRALKVQATMDNPGERLLPGMFADVRVVLPAEPDVVTIPETAVEYTLYGDAVFVVREEKGEDGKPVLKAVRTPVKTGAHFDNRVAVLSGLKPGDRVAASGQIKLANGMAVTIIESNALATPSVAPVN